ncbi:MAG TPA: transglycosylase SLT domain-containing protein [Candidatus Limnocylindrales bacterium]|nr:transglycosylase SLT domain-containing protein [Candidatus Limnocylindrales bacterium]
MRQSLEILFFVVTVTMVFVVLLTPKTLSPFQQNVEPSLNSLSSLDKNRTLFIQGVSYFDRGEYEKAWKSFETLKGQYKELEEYVLFYLAQTLNRLEKYEEALSIYQYLDKVYPEFPLLYEVRQAEAEILLRKQRYGEAAQLLGELVKVPSVVNKAELYYKLGQSLEGLQSWKEAVEAYQQLILYYPNHEDTWEAERRMNGILKEKGLSPPLLTEQMLYDGARAAFTAKVYQKAIDLYRILLAQYPQSPFRIEASFELAEAYNKAGKKVESINLLNNLIRDSKDENVIARALYEMGNLHSHKEALLRILTGYSKSMWADKALYLLGQLSEKQGKLLEAATWYTRIREQYPDSSLAEDALWRAGWDYYQLGQYSRADSLFSTIIQTFRDYKDEALYWKGRSAEKQNKIEEALVNYRELIDHHEESYYAVLAEMRLKKLKADPENQQPETKKENQRPDAYEGEALDLFTTNKWQTFLNTLKGRIEETTYNRTWSHLPKALELSQVYLTPYASREIQYLLEGFKPQTPSQEDLLFKYLMGRAYCEVKDYLACIKLVMQIKEDLKQLQIQNFPYRLEKLKYPLAYEKEIQKYSEKYRLDPFLVAGLIRQESGYNVKSLSPSNAMGLMQIIPPTGKYIAEQVNFRGFHPDLLYEPETNIAFGTWYLAYLLNRFNGNLFKAVAGYNAGPGAIERWWKDFERLDSDEIVENIPFRETRNYVKLVLRNWNVYRRIYGSTKP